MPYPIPKRLFDALMGQAVDISRVEAQFQREIARLLEQLRRNLEREIQESGLDTDRQDWLQPRMRELLKVSNSHITDSYSVISTKMGENLHGVATLSNHGLVKAFNKVLGVNLFQSGLTDAVLEKLADATLIQGATSKEWWERQSFDFTRFFADQMRMGLANGEGIKELRDRILPSQDMRLRENIPHRDIIKTARRNAEALVRTSTLTVMREAHLESYAANSDIISGIEWLSTLDMRTTPICRALDGLTWSLPDYMPLGHNMEYPGTSAHWNCRSVSIPVLKSWEQLAKEAGGDTALARKLDQIPEGDRASMDGPVDGGTTYSDWFAEQSEARQLEILGAGRYELYREGRVSIKDMVDFSGNLLRLDELREKYDFFVSRERFDSWYINPTENLVINNLPTDIQELLRSNADSLIFSIDSIVKQISKHPEIKTDAYTSVINRFGRPDEIYRVKHGRIALIIKSDKYYAAILKTTRNRSEVYLVSLHRLDSSTLNEFRKNERLK